MQRCPRCGVRNLDSDIACFNCDEILTGEPAQHKQAAQPSSDIPVEKACAAREERPARRAPAKRSFIGLVLGAFVYKIFLLLLAFGLFSIASLLLMWIAYDSTAGAVVGLSVLAVAVLFAFIYPDISRARLNGRLGGLVALLSDLIILGLFLPPVLIVVERKVSGAAGYVLDFYWVILGLLAEGFLIGFLFGYRAWRRDNASGGSPAAGTQINRSEGATR